MFRRVDKQGIIKTVTKLFGAKKRFVLPIFKNELMAITINGCRIRIVENINNCVQDIAGLDAMTRKVKNDETVFRHVVTSKLTNKKEYICILRENLFDDCENDIRVIRYIIAHELSHIILGHNDMPHIVYMSNWSKVEQEADDNADKLLGFTKKDIVPQFEGYAQWIF